MKLRFRDRNIVIFALIVMGGLYIFSKFYNRIYTPLTLAEGVEEYHLFIETNTTLDGFILQLADEEIVTDTAGFRWLAVKKNLHNHLNAGHYILSKDMTNTELVGLVRSGQQEPVDLVFNNIRTVERLAGLVSTQLEVDSLSLLEVIKKGTPAINERFNKQTLPAMFIPNTYELYWNISPQAFLDRMSKEYDRFWTKSRKKKAEKIGLDPFEVSTLASIVDEETYMDDEMPLIAGLYLYRIKKGYRLQADPTVKFANGKPEANRVLTADTKVDSPYNTYRVYGLPPGPITIPSIAAIDAVLNPEMKGYLYMCAKEDFSGYHNFAKTLVEHNRNADRYQRALNKRRIYK